MIWPLDDRFISSSKISTVPFVPFAETTTLKDYLTEKGYRLDYLDRPRDERIYKPPLVLFNNGFSKFAFLDYPVRFLHALHVISGESYDTDALLFLTAYLKSKLAYYFIFHTSANIGTERTKAQLEEVLNIPFFLPDAEIASVNAKKILRRGADAMRRLKARLEKEWTALVPEPSNGFRLEPETKEERIKKWEEFAIKETDQTMKTISPLIYEYFGLIDQEIILVEDTYNILKESIHQNRNKLDNSKGIRQKLDDTVLKEYSETLTKTLSSWMSHDSQILINAVCRINETLGLVCVELIQSKKPEPIKLEQLTEQEALAYLRLEDASTEKRGGLRYLRSIRHFDGGRIRIYKPARLGFWLRSVAINDAAALHAEIINSGGATK